MISSMFEPGDLRAWGNQAVVLSGHKKCECSHMGLRIHISSICSAEDLRMWWF